MLLQITGHDEVESEESRPREFDPHAWLNDEKYRRHFCLLVIDDIFAIARHNEPTELEPPETAP